MTFAIIKTGGKQYKVAEGSKLRVEKLDGSEGQEVAFEEVLMTGSDAALSVKIGQPKVEGAKVTGKILRQARAPKKIVFKYKSKTRYRKKKGHRQPFTEIEITSITA